MNQMLMLGSKDMDIQECEKIYGKLIKEDENHCWFEGKGEYGIVVPKHVYFSFNPEPIKTEDFDEIESMSKDGDSEFL